MKQMSLQFRSGFTLVTNEPRSHVVHMHAWKRQVNPQRPFKRKANLK